MSTVLAVKDALVELLGDSVPSGVQVQYSDDLDKAQPQRVFLGDIEEADGQLVTLRPGRREENYLVRVMVDVQHVASGRSADARALEVLGAIETLLADDPKLAGATTPPPIVSAYLERWNLQSSVTSDAWRTLIEVEIRVKARLLP